MVQGSFVLLSWAFEECSILDIHRMDGFKSMIALGDCYSGKTLGTTFWECVEAMRISEEADSLREEPAEAGGDTTSRS